MAGALILGMGMPTLPAYLIIILVMGPAIQALGVSMLTAHMFVFYYGVRLVLTPPVAIAAYAAAPIAGANPLMTAFMSFRLGHGKVHHPLRLCLLPDNPDHRGIQPVAVPLDRARTCFCIWLFSSALSAYDRRKLSMPEVVFVSSRPSQCWLLSPAIHLPAIAFGLALIAWDVRPQDQLSSRPEAAT